MTAMNVDLSSCGGGKKKEPDGNDDQKTSSVENAAAAVGPKGEWLRSSMRKSVSFVISMSSSARASLILESRSSPFLTALRFGYTLLLIFRTIFFIFCADVSGDFSDPYRRRYAPQDGFPPSSSSLIHPDSFMLFLNSFLSGSLIPILAMGICGVIYKRCTLYWIAAVLQQIACLCWYMKILMQPGQQLDSINFAYDLTLVTITCWIIREHNVAKVFQQLAKGSTATVRVVEC